MNDLTWNVMWTLLSHWSFTRLICHPSSNIRSTKRVARNLVNLCIFRGHNNAQFLHNVQWFSFHVASSVQFNCYERLGWCVYVLHLRISSGVCVCELCGKEKTFAQRSVQARRKSGNAGKLRFLCTCGGENALGHVRIFALCKDKFGLVIIYDHTSCLNHELHFIARKDKQC